MSEKESESSSNPYDILVNSIFNWIKITSNIDLAFAKALKKSMDSKRAVANSAPHELPKNTSIKDLIVYNGFEVRNLDPNKLYHLHGIIDEPSSLIFTTLDYINTYYKKNSNVSAFLSELFNEYTVVFMGYGLEELQILESVVNNNGGRQKQKHFALFGAYLNEMNFFNLRKEYFKTLDIELQHFYLDFDRYDRIVTVLQKWKAEIEIARGSDFHKKVDFIDDVLNGTN